MVVWLIIAFLILSLLEVPDLIRKRWWRELAAYSFLLALGFGLSLLMVLHYRLPPVVSMIMKGIRVVFGW